jgi:hypothetical protein
MKFDPTLMVRQVRERLENSSIARHRRMREQVITHLEGESVIPVAA